jgi:phage replication O-like protein O
MSATSYRPACAAAQNSGTISLSLGVKLGFIKDNRFLFDYEHAKIIYDRCLDHISTCQLSARCLRVFNTILRQTVGFSKLEDHATTTRLEQLTKIRHDHIGNTLRYLSKRNIIKWRKGGQYNNYLSINYDFASWGERNPDKQKPNNDPTILLPDYYIKTPIDQGLCFDNDEEDQPQFDKDLNDSLLETEETDKYLDKDSVIQVVSEIIDDKFTQIKQLLKDNNQTKNPEESQIHRAEKTAIHTQQPDESIEPAKVIKNIQSEKQEYEIKAYQREIEALKQQSEQEITQLKQQSKQEISDLKQQSEQEITKIKQQSEKIQLENSRLHEKQIEVHVQNQAPEYSISGHAAFQNPSNTPDLNAMDYPLQLSENDRISAKNIVIKSPHKAQDILDLLTIRLNQPQPVLNNPMAYLARLVQKEQQNELDFSALQTFVRPQRIQRELQALIDAHNRHYGQYQTYGEAVENYDFKPKDPENFAALEQIEDKHIESFKVAQDSYNVLKQYIAEHQLDKIILKQVDSTH